MRLRFPLLLKKRGRRRTGSPRSAQAAELLYQLMFVVAGVIGCWWLFQDVLLPEWRLAREAESFQRTTCEVVASRVSVRPGLADPEYCAELLVRFRTDADEDVEVWTRHGVGRDAPSRDEAAAALDRFEIGADQPCWYDPSDPRRVLLSVRQRWWPWLILSVPISLVVAGVVGIVLTLLTTQSSPERRVAIGQRVARVTNEPSPSQPAGYALPPADRVNDSPGVQLAYRLPIDGAESWRILAMAAVCVLWNALAAVFVFQMTAGFSVGGRIGLSALAIAPLAATGAWLTYSLIRDARSTGGAGATRVEIAAHPLHPGDRCDAVLLAPGSIRTITVSLVCSERATFRQGTDSRTTTAEVHREVVLRERSGGDAGRAAIGHAFEIAIPDDAPSSFVAPNNQVAWLLEVVVGPPRRPEAFAQYRLCVYPRSVRSDSEAA